MTDSRTESSIQTHTRTLTTLAMTEASKTFSTEIMKTNSEFEKSKQTTTSMPELRTETESMMNTYSESEILKQTTTSMQEFRTESDSSSETTEESAKTSTYQMTTNQPVRSVIRIQISQIFLDLFLWGACFGVKR